MPAKAAAVSESMAEDIELTEEEKTSLAAEEAGTEAPAQPEPQPQQQAEPAAKEAPPPKKEKSVPMERMDALNERLKATEQQLAETQVYRERWARLEERQKQAQEAANAARAAEEAAKQRAMRPDPDLDPAGARAYDAEQRAIAAEQRVMALEQQWQQTQVQSQAQNANLEMQSWLAFQVPQARATVPDYDTRVDYSRAARTAWWSRTFEFPDGHQIQLFPLDVAQNITQNEELVLLNRAKQLGLPIGMVVNALSDMWGYQQWANQRNGNALPPPQQMATNGQARPAAPAQLLPSGNEKLAQIERGQAVQGLGRVPSGESTAGLAWQTMSAPEFKAFVAQMPEDQYLQMLGNTQYGKDFEKRISMIDMTEAA